MTDSIEQLALRQVADLTALTPGTYFEEPHTPLSLDEAYDVQERIVQHRETNGEQVGGYKIGCLGPKIRQTFGMDGPIRGTLFRNEFHRSGSTLSCAKFANLAIEGEMAIRIGADGKPESVFPVIELHHFVLRSDPRSLQELIVNNGLNAGAVFPHSNAVSLDPDAMIEIEINGQPIDSVPLWGFPGGSEETLDWISGHLAARGLSLKPGNVVLAGTLSDIFPVGPGDVVTVKVGQASEVRLALVP